MRVSETGFLAAGICTAALAFAPMAAADGTADFLEELGINNVSLPGLTPSQTVTAGYAACADLKGGVSVLDEMSAVEKRYGFAQGTLFVSASTTHLCPDFAAGG